MSNMTRLHTSLEYLPVAKIDADIVDFDPTGDTVKAAFISTGELPADSDFKTAFWQTDTVTNPNKPVYKVMCLVGPGGTVELAVANYKRFVKITDSPEVPILEVDGVLIIK